MGEGGEVQFKRLEGKSDVGGAAKCPRAGAGGHFARRGADDEEGGLYWHMKTLTSQDKLRGVAERSRFRFSLASFFVFEVRRKLLHHHTKETPLQPEFRLGGLARTESKP